MSVISKQKRIAIGFLLAVSMGYAASSCSASLVSIADTNFNQGSSAENSADRPAPGPAGPQQYDVPFHSPMMDTSMSSTPSIISGSTCISVLNASNRMDVLESATGKVYLLSWMWLPSAPVVELLKVPILS